jgi:hypothetical protein
MPVHLIRLDFITLILLALYLVKSTNYETLFDVQCERIFSLKASAAALLLVKNTHLRLKECKSNGDGKYSSESITRSFISFHKSYKNTLYIKVIPTVATQKLKRNLHSTDSLGRRNSYPQMFHDFNQSLPLGQ